MGIEMRYLAVALGVLVLGGLGGEARATEQSHLHHRTPSGHIHCSFITRDYESAFSGTATCTTRAMFMRLWGLTVHEHRRAIYVPTTQGGVPNPGYPARVLEAGRTYRFYPSGGRTMFWATVRRVGAVESINVRNEEGHGFRIRVRLPSGRTGVVRF